MPDRPTPLPMVRTAVDESLQMFFNFDESPLLLLSPDEIFQNANEALLTDLREDRRLERKPCHYSGDSLGEYFSMWGNTSPDGGLIVSGQFDNGGFEGCGGLPIERINALEKTGYVFCSDAKYDVRCQRR